MFRDPKPMCLRIKSEAKAMSSCRLHVVYMSSTSRSEKNQFGTEHLQTGSGCGATTAVSRADFQQLPQLDPVGLVISRRAIGSIENHGKSPALPGFFVGLCLPMVWFEQNLQMLSLAQVCEVVSHQISISINLKPLDHGIFLKFQNYIFMIIYAVLLVQQLRIFNCEKEVRDNPGGYDKSCDIEQI